MCQRLEVPRKTTICHLKCFTVWVEGFKEEYFRHKHHRACRPCDSQCFCLPGSASSIFCWEHWPYSHHNSFPDQWLLNVHAGSIARRKLSWVSQAAHLGGRTPKAPGDNSVSTPATGQHLNPLSPTEEGQGGSLSHLFVSVSPANNFVQTDPKLRGPTWSLGGHRQPPANKAPAWHTTFGMTRFLVQNLKRKRKVLALGVKSQSCYLTLASSVNLSEPVFPCF